jgi:hypothetical protein
MLDIGDGCVDIIRSSHRQHLSEFLLYLFRTLGLIASMPNKDGSANTTETTQWDQSASAPSRPLKSVTRHAYKAGKLAAAVHLPIQAPHGAAQDDLGTNDRTQIRP